jgi:ADP-ribose pyrophosphatase YjhB (NUDIX family)
VGHYCLKCGAPLVIKTIEGRDHEACPHDDFVLWRDPKVATAVVVEIGAGIVMGRRSIEPGYGEWCLPGGYVNHDEDPAAAAVRECREEIGAEVRLQELLGVYHVSKMTAASIVGIAYRGLLVEGGTLAAGPEMFEVAVFRPGELPPLAFPSHREVLAMYGAARARSASPPSPAPAGSRPQRTP